ncbi:toxin-antitoxin system YwqK family antitoxin [candidate division WWE3 bacterium]|nr:toxin-antitoxin system YwqK family antitoxin [candidate division WWE3 bacterium]
MNKTLTLLLSLSFLLLFSSFAYCEEPVDKQYWDNGKLKWETYYDEKQEKVLGVGWYKSGKKEVEVHYINSQEGEQSSLKEDGKLSTWYENGNRKAVGVFKNGQREGLETTWYESGKKWSESNYKDGKRDGLTTAWYESGNKIEEYNYKNGELDGEQTKWYGSGIKQTTRHYTNAKENGVRTEWDKDGKQTFQGNFVNGVKR